MEYKFKGINVEELHLKLNQIKIDPANKKLEVAPLFGRTVKAPIENEKIKIITLGVMIKSTPEKPWPYDLSVRIAGIFETVEVLNEKEMQQLSIEATTLLYPYLRSIVSSVTSMSYTMPIFLPVIPDGKVFPEDKNA